MSYTDRDYEAQRTERLLTAISDWRASFGRPEHGRDRRYALRLLASERRRRDQMRLELRAAAGMLPVMTASAEYGGGK